MINRSPKRLSTHSSSDKPIGKFEIIGETKERLYVNIVITKRINF